jgi:glycosyltransferase involved in cell wall biosynthesis
MTIQLYISDTTIILAVFVALFIILYVRKNIEFTNKNRLAPFREPLVPEEFWKVCRRSESITIVWIIRHYLPDFKAGAESMAYDINKYLVEVLGWKVIVIVPHSSVGSYGGVEILQFYQKTEIELAISKAHCIFSQYQVIETAAITCARSKKPLVLFAHDDSLGPWIVKAKSIHNNVNIVNNSEWIANINRQYTLNSFVLNPPVDWRRYITYSERRYITLVNMNGNKGAEQFFKIAAALPEYEFLGVAGSYAKQMLLPLSSNVTLWKSQSDMRVVYNVTGILCTPSKHESWGRVAIEACASGIPVIASPTAGLKEALSYAGIFAELDDIATWVQIIRKLKTDPLYYKKYAELTVKRSHELDPKSQLDNFKVWVEEL